MISSFVLQGDSHARSRRQGNRQRPVEEAAETLPSSGKEICRLFVTKNLMTHGYKQERMNGCIKQIVKGFQSFSSSLKSIKSMFRSLQNYVKRVGQSQSGHI